jgi:hypothetical protein
MEWLLARYFPYMENCKDLGMNLLLLSFFYTSPEYGQKDRRKRGNIRPSSYSREAVEKTTQERHNYTTAGS